MCTDFQVNGTLSNGKVFGALTSGAFLMTCAHLRGISPSRHVDFLAFSALLMDCS